MKGIHNIIRNCGIILLTILVSSCQSGGGAEYYSVQGFTQGTTYHITYQHPTEYELKGRIDSLLRVFDSSLSTYDTTSIISRINRNEPNVKTDTLFRTVFRESARVHQISGGAFDITLGPVERLKKCRRLCKCLLIDKKNGRARNFSSPSL